MARSKLSLILLLPLALLAIGLAMVQTARSQRDAATHAAARTDAANRLLLGMLDQETGLRGYLLTGREDFLTPFTSGMRETGLAERAIRDAGRGDPATLELMSSFSRVQGAWRRLAEARVGTLRKDPDAARSIAGALQRKRIMDRLRALDTQLKQRLDVRRDADLSAAGRRAEVLIVALVALIGLGAYLLLTHDARRRRAGYRRELAYRQSQRELTDALQVVRSEAEAHALLERHLGRVLPGAHVTVFDGGAPGGAPLVVGGEVIGSVLVEGVGALDDDARRHLDDSVAQAAPVIANLRNLATAERRAATDSLTGLPNRRAVQHALVQMTARARRSGQPLAAIAMDLDRFKDINDRFGHDMGDQVLKHVAALLSSACRVEDLVGRIGGEEFIVLAPHTDIEGAAVLAENLRAALASASVPGLGRDVTGSFGVAVLRDHAATAEELLRLADRALYTAKRAGRNRVEVIARGAVTHV